MMPMGIYEVGLGLWLLVKGIQVPLRRKRPTRLRRRLRRGRRSLVSPWRMRRRNVERLTPKTVREQASNAEGSV